tara:strand:- start:1512 stop:1736 length:225 start_codon:yes stop_codon:yes gene_type:complete
MRDYTNQQVFDYLENLKISETQMYIELIENFKNMAKGGNGGVPDHLNGISIREYYYTGWPDARFRIILEELGEL